MNNISPLVFFCISVLYIDSNFLFLKVHDINLKKWAIQKSRELNINFKASNNWINRFKSKYRIRSRKITKFINITPAMDKQKTESVIQFVNNSKLLFQNFGRDHILNTDQSGFNY